MGNYNIQESVGTALEPVHVYEDIEIHHPSQRGREPGRSYSDVGGEREEVLRTRTSGNHLMVSKDFILTDSETGSSRVTVPAPISGYIGRIDERNGLVTIHDRQGGELVAQIRHMDLGNSSLQEGQRIEYGQPLGLQGGYGGGNAHKYGTHVHVDFNEQYLDQFKQYIHDIDAGVITPDSYPALLSNRYNPHNFLYIQALDRVHLMEVERCIIPGPHSENLAAALTHAAIRDRLTRIDRVELNDTGTLARAVQVGALRDEPGLNRTTLSVSTQAASQQPLDWTSEQVRQLDAAIRVQQQEQPQHQQWVGALAR